MASDRTNTGGTEGVLDAADASIGYSGPRRLDEA